MKRHAIRAGFIVHFIQCICGDEDIQVEGSFPDPEDAFEIESLTCGEKHDIEVDSLSDFDRTRIEEYAELRRGDFIASYCSYVEDMNE